MALVRGYRSVRSPDPEAWSLLPWFDTLRRIYVLLSRLDRVGSHPTDEQEVQLATFRQHSLAAP